MLRTLQNIGLPVLLLLIGLAGCAQPGPQALKSQSSAGPRAAESREPDKRQQAVSKDLQRAADYLASENYPQAKTYYAKALAAGGIVPADTYYHYGYVLNRTGDYQVAMEQFAIYTQKVNSGQGFYAEAMQEWSFAGIQLANQQEQARQAAEEEARQQVIAAAQQSQPDVPQQKVQELQQAVQELAAKIVEPLSGIELLLVRGGCYQMGDQFGEAGERELPHEVCVDDFYLGKYEVTQGQWQQLMGYNPAYFQSGDDYPVETVSWLEAQVFIQLLNRAGADYRLPTEAEWEYAARSGGKKQRFSGGDEVDAFAWYRDNSGGTTHPVGQKQANGLGLYDMSGNVSEWCQDYHVGGYYQISPRDNPAGPAAPGEPGNRRVRGGSFDNSSNVVRSSSRRYAHEESGRENSRGFRIALPLPRQSGEKGAPQ